MGKKPDKTFTQQKSLLKMLFRLDLDLNCATNLFLKLKLDHELGCYSFLIFKCRFSTYIILTWTKFKKCNKQVMNFRQVIGFHWLYRMNNK